MVIIWDKICYIFTSLVKPTRRKTRVTFSPSTLHREIMRHAKLTATPNPFFNFLAELRMQAQTDDGNNRSLTPRKCVQLSKTAGRLWNSMSDEQKQPYRKVAMEQKKIKRKRKRSSRRRRRGRKSTTKLFKSQECLIATSSNGKKKASTASPEIIADCLLNNNNNSTQSRSLKKI